MSRMADRRAQTNDIIRRTLLPRMSGTTRRRRRGERRSADAISGNSLSENHFGRLW